MAGAPTLTDFLAARIAEEETYWRAARHGPHRNHEAGLLIEGPGLTRYGMPWMLRECVSRRIVAELHDGAHQCVGSVGTGVRENVWVDFGQTCETQRALALPYTEHSAFSPEWRLS